VDSHNLLFLMVVWEAAVLVVLYHLVAERRSEVVFHSVVEVHLVLFRFLAALLSVV
jgi:hypothetical protein